jgi:hypothetical protein
LSLAVSKIDTKKDNSLEEAINYSLLGSGGTRGVLAFARLWP